ncbi:MAG TPA: hypothetical protein VGN72_20910 [Tepidisphaeraceae bacterium]|nr:hypothetical protein [Tepidisphaeraceae bacterium]
MSPRTTDVGAASRQFGEPNPDATPEPFTEIDKPVFTVPGVYGNYIKPRYRNYNRALSPNYVRPQSNNFDDGSGMSGAPMRSNNTPAGGTNKASGGNYMKPQR